MEKTDKDEGGAGRRKRTTWPQNDIHKRRGREEQHIIIQIESNTNTDTNTNRNKNETHL